MTHRGWHSRNYLPHFDSQDVVQFVTFRLADSLPRHVVEMLRRLDDATLKHDAYAPIVTDDDGRFRIKVRTGAAVKLWLRLDLFPQRSYEVASDRTDVGDLVVDAHQQTSVPGIYAAGDVVDALNQITVAVGQAAIAATAMHNALLRHQG